MATFTLEEVHRHRSKDSLWVAHQGRVYDVTGFVDRHPGGWDVLVEKGGDDVTQVMRDTPHSHSPAAYQILNKYLIGELQQKDTAQTGTHTDVKNGHANGDVPKSKSPRTGTSRAEEHTGGYSMLGWKEDEIIDWSKPIFWQVGKLGKDYDDWVHSPVDRHIRLFYSDFAEFFSETPWWVIPILWLPVAATFLVYGSVSLHEDTAMVNSISLGHTLGTGLPTTVGAVMGIFLAGILLWTFLEYTVHRWLFHLDPPDWSPFLITTHFILHGQHHKAPFDKDRLVFPPLPAALFAIFFWCLYVTILPKPIAQVLISGTILGYVIYDLTHYYLHHGTPNLNYFRSLKTYHVKHHFLDQKKGFGISSKFWDYPFSTLSPDTPTRHIVTNNNKKTS